MWRFSQLDRLGQGQLSGASPGVGPQLLGTRARTAEGGGGAHGPRKEPALRDRHEPAGAAAGNSEVGRRLG